MERQFFVQEILLINPRIQITKRNLGNAEKYFKKMRDVALSKESKRQFARAHALVRWAKRCNASIESISQTQERVTFRFIFKTADDVCKYDLDYINQVEGIIWSY